MLSVRRQDGPLIAKHLLRALLRECTYLPDSAARTYCSRYILDRFRSSTKQLERHERSVKARAGLPQLSTLRDSPEVWTTQRLKKARKGLSLLRRANNGEDGPLSNILLHTYGRAGARRRQLIAALLQDETNEVTVAESSPTDQAHVPSLAEYLHTTDRFTQFVTMSEQRGQILKFTLSSDYPKLKALAESQTQVSFKNSSRAKLRRAGLTVPTTNLFLRPMPRRRTKNIVKRWFADLLDKLMPPLPQTEWTRLTELVSGQIKWEGLPKRRPGRPLNPNQLCGPQLEAVLDAEGSNLPFSVVRRAVLEDALLLSPLNKRFLGRDRPHHLTLRYMRRLWTRVLSQSCVMAWDETYKKWVLTWGYKCSGFMAENEAMFAGVDMHGKRQQ